MKRFHELLFTQGNITVRYHMLSREFSPTEEDWREWLEGLPENIRKHAQEEGGLPPYKWETHCYYWQHQ